MTIANVIVVPGIGNVIMGGNPEITKNDTSKLCRKGQSIIIITQNREFVFKVLDVQFSLSIAEAVIIGTHLEESEDFHRLKAGDLIYKI